MRRIINGRKYDTGTATALAEWSNDYPVNDFHYVAETLYRKRTGEYFVHGEGGPASKYAMAVGNSGWRGGEQIVPLSYEAARRWAEEHLDTDDYEAIFGKVSEDGGDAVLSVRVPVGTKRMVDQLAAKAGMGKGEVVARAVAAMYGDAEGMAEPEAVEAPWQ